jgi:hypothetical protein
VTADHEHASETATDAEALQAAAAQLAWPDDAPDQLSEVERCTVCDRLQRIAWIDGDAEALPGWMLQRLLEHAHPPA